MQRQPTSDGAGVSKIVLRPATIECSITRGVWTTTRREALGLEIDKHISSDFRTLQIVQKGKGAEIQPYLKTQNGERQVDLCTSLPNMLRDYVGDRHAGYLFRTSTGNLLGQANILRDSLHPLLESTHNESGGSTSSRGFAARTSKRQNVRKFCVTSGQAMRRHTSASATSNC